MNDKHEWQPAEPFARLPYPLTAPEDTDEINQEALRERAISILSELLDDLDDLIEDWREAARHERAQLARAQPPHEVPLEHRAGMAQAFDDAANHLERVLEKARN